MIRKLLFALILGTEAFGFLRTGLADERVCVGPLQPHSREFQFDIRPVDRLPSGKIGCRPSEKELKLQRETSGVLLLLPPAESVPGAKQHEGPPLP